MELFEERTIVKIHVNGEVLKAVRNRYGITMRKMAEYCGIDYTYVCQLENNRVPFVSEKTKRSIQNGIKKLHADSQYIFYP